MRHKEEVGQPVQGPTGVSASVQPQEDLRGASWSNPKRVCEVWERQGLLAKGPPAMLGTSNLPDRILL